MTTDAITVPDGETWNDLHGVLGRAHRAVPDGTARLTGHGSLLLVTVDPIPQARPGITVLGLRAGRLTTPWHGDVMASLGDWMGRLARRPDDLILQIPPTASAPGGVLGTDVPRSGWEPDGDLDLEPALAVCAQVAANQLTVADVKWLRSTGDLGVPAAVVHAAWLLGFVPGRGTAAVHRCEGWLRLTGPGGYIVASGA